MHIKKRFELKNEQIVRVGSCYANNRQGNNTSYRIETVAEKLEYEKGHRDSNGAEAPWVIRSHKNNKVLASFSNRKDAERHLARMKNYAGIKTDGLL